MLSVQAYHEIINYEVQPSGQRVGARVKLEKVYRGQGEYFFLKGEIFLVSREIFPFLL